jgi:hypothetical protein
VGISSRFSRLRNQLQAQGVDLVKDINAVVDINVGGRHMPDRKLSQDELDRQEGEELPDREVMTTLNPPIHPVPPLPAEGDDVLYPTDPIHPESTGGTT